MEKTAADRIEEQLRSAFPEGAIERVQVLEYGDDPQVEPGETAIRAFISRAGDGPEGKEADQETVKAFEEANHAVIMKVRDHLARFIGWIEFRPDRPGEAATSHGPMLRIGGRGGQAKTPDEVSEEPGPGPGRPRDPRELGGRRPVDAPPVPAGRSHAGRNTPVYSEELNSFSPNGQWFHFHSTRRKPGHGLPRHHDHPRPGRDAGTGRERTRRSAPSCSSAAAPWSGTCARCAPSWTSASDASSTRR